MLRPTLAALIALALVGCTAGTPGAHATVPRSSHHSSVETPAAPAGPPPAHVVVVIEENHAYGEIIGNSSAPYFNQLARSGRLLTRTYAITHPSEPNYLALFSGSTHGVTDDSCPHTFAGWNLGAQLIAHHRTFVGYAQSLPNAGSPVCTSGEYARKHAPWVNFADLPAKRTNRPFTAFPRDYAHLPTVSFVVPNLDNDMHDGTIAQADTWLRTNLGGYARWAGRHHSLLIVTWDEDDGSSGNHIPTIIVGAGVKSGRDTHRATLYSLLKLIETEYRLRLLGGAGSAPAISLG
jgi:phosphatidylinositol-3-phosphatase